MSRPMIQYAGAAEQFNDDAAPLRKQRGPVRLTLDLRWRTDAEPYAWRASTRYEIPWGSYAHRTIINPVQTNDEFDADVLLSMKEIHDWEAESYVQELYTTFRAPSIYREMVSRHDRCVKINYANEVHIDVVPYLERPDEHFITNRITNAYELTNPEGFNEWLDERNRITGGRLIKVIRLLKFIRDYKNTFTVASVILNIFVGERINDVLLMSDPDYYIDVPTALKNILKDLNDYLQANPVLPLITDPSCPTESFNHRIDQPQYSNFRGKKYAPEPTESAGPTIDDQ
jgi:hypothetical protein